MQEIEVTFGHAAQVWWSWFWRSILFTILIGFFTGFIVGFFGHMADFTPKQIMPISMLLGAVIGVIVSIWILAKILKKKFRSFRIALIQC
jgi:hypothetical protein